MTIYYIRKTGNDTTGDGSDAAPWLTISKVIGIIGTGGGHTVNIGPGEYAENTTGLGYLFFNTGQAHSSLVTYQAEDPLNKPIVTVSGATQYFVRCAGLMNTTFKNLIFTDKGVTHTSGLFPLGTGTTPHDISWVNCEFNWCAGSIYGVSCILTSGKSASNLLVQDCVFNQIGDDPTRAIVAMSFRQSTAASPVDNVKVQRCKVSVQAKPLYIEGVTNFLIDGGYFASLDSYGILIGADGVGTKLNAGTVQNAAISSTNSHAILVGGGSNGVTVTGCTINGGNQGIVIKEATNCTATYNNIFGGSDSSLYFKASTNCTASYNTVHGWQGILGRVAYNSTTGNKCQNITFTYNRLFSSGVAPLLYWGGDTEDLGGGVCDFNLYLPGGSPLFGYVRSDPHVLTLDELKAAWAGYGDGSNDSHSQFFRLPVSHKFMMIGR